MPIDFVPDPELFGFESRWFDATAGRVHYVDEGDGVPLLLCHGNPAWSFLYRHLITRLRDRFRCIAPDYPGFGLSDRPPGYGYTPSEHARVTGELVDHLGLDAMVVMGQDWGGPIGTTVALERSERVRGLVLGNTWLWPSDAWDFQLFSRVMSSPVMRRRILERNFFVETLLPAGLATTLSRAEMDHYRGVQPDPAARVGVAALPYQIRAERPMLARLEREVPATFAHTPTLITWGMRDPVFRPRTLLPRMRAMFADHELAELPDAKHFIQEDAPAEIAAAIRGRFG